MTPGTTFAATLVLGLVAATAACRMQAGHRPVDGVAHRVDSIARTAQVDRSIPGMSVVVLHDDDTVFARGYGIAELGHPERVTPSTVFQLGSISKQFLSALVVALSMDGKLSLDDPVSRYLDSIPLVTPDITVAHLLNHTSGLREIFTYEEAGAAFDDLTRTRSQYHSFLRRIPSDFAPGSRWSYSNTNYALLALLVERLEGAPYEDVLVRRFFAPHGLGSLRQCQSLPQRPGEAFGHVLSNGAAAVAAPENMEWIRGDGGLCGNALDVARWSRLLATGRILPASGYERMTARTRVTSGPESDYGFGLSLVPLDGIRKVSHNGAMRGFSASAAYYPDSALTVVVLTNRGDVRTESIERAIARVLLGLPAPSTESIALTEAEATRYVGTFDIGVFHIRIRQREGGMWLEMPPPGPTTRLVYRGYGRFVGAGDPDATVVTFSSSGQMVTLFMGAMNWTGTRRAEQP